MLSAWRKLTKKQDEKPVFPMGVAPIDQNMQKKYARGVQYNMKIIIKGDRNTGKSMVLQRLTGSKYKEEYIPTQEIQVANINWNYKGAGDIVKVEVWDIVDKSRKKRTPSGSLKITNDNADGQEELSDPTDSLALDAEFIDVYKGTHGVILTMDITKAWTWQYVQRELEKIPQYIPVLILANFRDMGDHRVMDADEIIAYIENLDRPTGSAELYFTEASMKDGFGLHFIYKFLNMPFLMLQRETLLRQLEANTLEIEDTREALSVDPGSDDQNYGLFKEMLLKKQNPSLYPKDDETSGDDGKPKEDVQQTNAEDNPQPVAQPVARQVAVVPPVETEDVKPAPKQLPVATVSPNVVSNDDAPKVSKFQAYKAKLFGGGSNNEVVKEEVKVEPQPTDDVVPIEEFNPGHLDDSFLSDNTSSTTKQRTPKKLSTKMDSDDDSDDGNPMVAGFEDLESDEDVENVDVIAVANDDDGDDFEDLSDDERPDIDSPRESFIMDKVKASKQQQKQKKQDTNTSMSDDLPTEIVIMTEELDVDKPDYANLDSDEDADTSNTAKQIIESTSNVTVTEDVDTIDDTTSEKDVDIKETTTAKPSKAKPEPSKTVSVSSEDLDERDNVFVVAADMDVQEDWMNEKDSDDEVDDVDDKEEEQATNTKDSNTKQQQDTSINFDLDDLEAFMSNQMSKASQPPIKVVTSVVEPSEAEKPKKKKKKKTTVTVTESTEPSTEKRKKKKAKTKDTDDVDATTTTTTKTKKSKPDTSSDSGVKKTKKSATKKTITPQNTLDDFFAS